MEKNIQIIVLFHYQNAASKSKYYDVINPYLVMEGSVTSSPTFIAALRL